MPKLSLCLIAKNEEAFLEGCLKSVEGVVDEMIVLDTGSTDATPEIAAAAGARVVHRAWDDDFSAARNAALDASTGDWILVLDADERLVGGEALRRALKGPEDGWLVALHNADALDAPFDAVLDGSRRLDDPVSLPRVFRRTPDLRWEGRVHEQPRSWFLGNRRVGFLEGAAIVHLGCVPSLREARDKRSRNVQLLRARCEEAPDDVPSWAHLASELFHDGRPDEAWEAVEGGWNALAGLPKDHPVALVPLLTVRATLQFAKGDLDGVMQTVAAKTEEHPNLWMLEALVLSRRAARDDDSALRGQAIALLERCLAWDGTTITPPLPGLRSYLTHNLLGELFVAEGRLDAAARAFDTAGLDHPEPERPRLGRIEVDVRRGMGAEALVALEPMLDDRRADPWILAALASRDLGQPRDLSAFVSMAEQLQEKGVWAAHRARLLAELRCEAALYRGRYVPGFGEVGRLAALTFRTPDPTDPVPVQRAGQIALNLIRIGRADALDAWLEARGEARVPGLREHLLAALSAQGITLDEDGEPDFVFVGGAGRSGTTLFRAMLDAHPRIHCGPELKVIPPFARQLEAWREEEDLPAAGVTPELLDAAGRAFLRTVLEGRAPAGMRIAEKTPHNLVQMTALARMFPRARFLHVIRDGRAVTASLLRQDWRDPATGEKVPICRDIPTASAYWAQVVETIRAQASAVPGRYLEVHYEQLVKEPEQEMRRVLAFIGEPWDPAVLAHERAGVQLSPHESSSAAAAAAINTAPVDRWREDLSPSDLRQLAPQAVEWLDTLGYPALG